jgi:hypothetical protein
MNVSKIIKLHFLSFLLVFVLCPRVSAQDDDPNPGRQTSFRSELWNGLYTKYRIGEKLYFNGEYHLRTRDQLVNNLAQVYLRFGLSYLIDKSLEVTAGVATPLYWAPKEYELLDASFDKMVPQYRLWQQLLFVQSLSRAKVYHQIRTEQRWRRDWLVDSPFELTFRWRYKLATYIPLNSMKLQKGTYFLSLNNEVFVQSGKTIIRNPFEENRTFLGMGYILNENIQFQGGYTFSFQQRPSGIDYVNRGLVRFSVYHNLDFTRKKKDAVDFQPLF